FKSLNNLITLQELCAGGVWRSIAASFPPTSCAMNARTDIDSRPADDHRVQHWIAGTLTPGTGDRTQDVFNPATGAVTRQVAMDTPQDVAAAVASAKSALPAWSGMSPLRRARVLNKFLGLMNEHRDEIAAAITREHGKVFTDAQGEVTRGIEIVE